MIFFQFVQIYTVRNRTKYKYKYKKKIRVQYLIHIPNTEVIIISYFLLFYYNNNQLNTEHPFLSVNVQNQKSTHT